MPVINCGDGWGEHPTQVLTDLYTTQKELGPLDGLTFLLVGDMRMRTMHSILYALSQFDAKAYVVGPPEMSLLPEFKLELDERNVRYEEAESVEDVIAECDVIYMEPVVQADYTESRDERGDGGGVATTPRTYQVTRELLRRAGEAGLDHPAQPAADGRAARRRRRDAPRALLAGGVQRRRDADGAARARAGGGGVSAVELTLNGEPVSVEPRDGREPARAAARASSACAR